MIDRLYAEPALAALYDSFNTGVRDLESYLPLVISADSVLDVGCGTGELLRLAREAGHGGRLCGLDPAKAMLREARRKRPDVEWRLGNLGSVDWQREFDLVVMCGHASVLRFKLIEGFKWARGQYAAYVPQNRFDALTHENLPLLAG